MPEELSLSCNVDGRSSRELALDKSVDRTSSSEFVLTNSGNSNSSLCLAFSKSASFSFSRYSAKASLGSARTVEGKLLLFPPPASALSLKESTLPNLACYIYEKKNPFKNYIIKMIYLQLQIKIK